MSKDAILRTGLTGGGAGDLDNYPVADCETGKIALAVISTGHHIFYYDETESGAESSPNIIIPDDNSSGTGAWVLSDIVTGDITADGIYLGGSGSDNYLDDYEEGTHTATITCDTSGTVTLKSDIDTLAYTKVGRQVTITGRLEVDSVSSPEGRFSISLPFSIENLSEKSENFASAVTMDRVSAANVADFVTHSFSSSYLRVFLGDGTNYATDSAEELQADTRIIVGATYFTS